MIESHNLLSTDLDQILASTPDLWEELRGRRIFITGASGFIGCWLLETFMWANQHLGLEASATVLTRNPQRFRQRLPHLADCGLEVVVGDVRNFAFPENKFSHIIHAATDSSAELNAQQPELMFDTIVEGTRHCLDFAARSGATKFLLTSSGAVYGKQPPNLAHVTENFNGGPDPLEPASAYAEGKRAAELLCALAARQTGIQVKIARCFAFVGPYMKLDAHFAIGNFIRDRLEGAPIRVSGDGTPVRTYMYASDLMIWLWTILLRGNSGRAYNVGSEEDISIAELARAVSESGSQRTQVEILGQPVAGAAVARYAPSTERARNELGLRCAVSLRAAIESTVKWNRAQCSRELQSR
jgi:dTDP-glucose 4,6-dehydratase